MKNLLDSKAQFLMEQDRQPDFVYDNISEILKCSRPALRYYELIERFEQVHDKFVGFMR